MWLYKIGLWKAMMWNSILITIRTTTLTPTPLHHHHTASEEKAHQKRRKDERSSSSRSFVCSSKGSAEGASENPLPQSPQGHSQLGCSQASLLPRCIIHSLHLSFYLSIYHHPFTTRLQSLLWFSFHLCLFFSHQINRLSSLCIASRLQIARV